MNLESAAHAIGKDGFNWWIGQVENDGSDPENDGEGRGLPRYSMAHLLVQ